jgi:hypothetical protein
MKVVKLSAPRFGCLDPKGIGLVLISVRGTINNNDRKTATMCSLGTGFVSGICVWIPCIKETDDDDDDTNNNNNNNK